LYNRQVIVSKTKRLTKKVESKEQFWLVVRIKSTVVEDVGELGLGKVRDVIVQDNKTFHAQE